VHQNNYDQLIIGSSTKLFGSIHSNRSKVIMNALNDSSQEIDTTIDDEIEKPIKKLEKDQKITTRTWLAFFLLFCFRLCLQQQQGAIGYVNSF